MFCYGNRMDNEMSRWIESVLVERSTKLSTAASDGESMIFFSTAGTSTDESLPNSSDSSSTGSSLSYNNTMHEELTIYDNLLPSPKDSPPSFSSIADTDAFIYDAIESPVSEVYHRDVVERQEEYYSLGNTEESRVTWESQPWNTTGQNIDPRVLPSAWYHQHYAYAYPPYFHVYHHTSPSPLQSVPIPEAPPLQGTEEERAKQYIEFRLRQLMKPSGVSRIYRVPPSPHPSIREPTDNDVMGRGLRINAIAGNQKFRRLIQSQQPKYRSISRKEKPVFARCLVEFIRYLGGRFLNYDPVTKLYSEVGDEKAESKTGQALREQSNPRRRRSSAAAVAASSMEHKDETAGDEEST